MKDKLHIILIYIILLLTKYLWLLLTLYIHRVTLAILIIEYNQNREDENFQDKTLYFLV